MSSLRLLIPSLSDDDDDVGSAETGCIEREFAIPLSRTLSAFIYASVDVQVTDTLPYPR